MNFLHIVIQFLTSFFRREEIVVKDEPIDKESEEEMNWRKDICIILSFGHGATDPETGEYHCIAGGKEHTFQDGLNVREGDLNRIYQPMLVDAFQRKGYTVKVVSADVVDVPILERNRRSNEIAREFEYTSKICFHHNASKNGKARGWEVHTSRGQDASDLPADYTWLHHVMIQRTFKTMRLRSDMVDGDHDFENNFSELVNFDGTTAIYVENGFFDNRQDYERVIDPAYIPQACNALVKGQEDFYTNLFANKIHI